MWLKRFRDWFNWGWLAYRIIWVLVVTGVLGSVGGSVWAVLIGVPLPIVLMAGYCTLVAAVFLAMVPLAYQVLLQASAPPKASIAAPAQKQPRPPEPPNYAAWRLVPDYTLHDAAHLWCDIDPNDTSTYDTSAWFKVLKAKVQDRTLKINTSWPNDRRLQDAEIRDADARVRITRGSLHAFAKANGFDPRFLRD